MKINLYIEKKIFEHGEKHILHPVSSVFVLLNGHL